MQALSPPAAPAGAVRRQGRCRGRLPRARGSRVTCAASIAEFQPSEASVDALLGEGSYGQVYLGTLRRAGGPGETVVLKKAKRGVENALEMQEAELYFNARVSRDTDGACAKFLGVIRVDRRVARAAGRRLQQWR